MITIKYVITREKKEMTKRKGKRREEDVKWWLIRKKERTKE